MSEDLFPDHNVLKQIHLKKVVHFFNRKKKHFHVCLLIDEEFYHFAIFNSKREGSEVVRLIKSVDKDPFTFVHINGEQCGFALSGPTVINCNDIVKESPESLVEKITSGELEFKGVVSDVLYKKILTAAERSIEVDKGVKKIFKEKLKYL